MTAAVAKPIIFSAPMIRALLDGRKRMTRRIVSPRNCEFGSIPAGKLTKLFWDHADWSKANPDRGFPDPRAGGAYTSGYLHVPSHDADEGVDSVDCAVCQEWGWAGTSHRLYPRLRPGDLLWVKHAVSVAPVYRRAIAFGEGKYAAGTDGNIYRREAGRWMLCKAQINDKGYQRISLRHCGEQINAMVNRLVVEAFYPPPPPSLTETRHMNNNRSDNRPENLDWGTSAQNTADAIAAGHGFGERSPLARLTEKDVEEIRLADGTHGKIAESYGVARSTVSMIKSGKRWRGQSVTEPPQRNMPAFKLWTSSRFMPRWASSITLKVTGVKVERLQDISEADAIAEGIEPLPHVEGAWLDYGGSGDGYAGWHDAPLSFRSLWESINGAAAWNANPFVVAVSFEVIKSNIDSVLSGSEAA